MLSYHDHVELIDELGVGSLAKVLDVELADFVLLVGDEAVDDPGADVARDALAEPHLNSRGQGVLRGLGFVKKRCDFLPGKRVMVRCLLSRVRDGSTFVGTWDNFHLSVSFSWM
jgi:hypothetical protein